MRRRDERPKSVAAGYPGGKAGSGIYQRIINQIPPHEIYVEPFLGGGAIMYHKRRALLDVGVDINSDTIAHSQNYLFWGELHVGDGLEYLHWLLGWHIEAAQGRSAGNRRQEHGRRPNRVSARGQTLPAKERRQQKQRPFPDPVAQLGGTADPRIVVYCDPPYLRSSRRSKESIYLYEASDLTHDGKDEGWHIQLLNALNALPFPVLLSGYQSGLYRKMLKAPKWRAISYQAPIRGGNVATEYLWCNFPQPRELHDYRYLGENRRERERVKRKKNRWTAKLKAMPDLERYAMLGALQETNQGEPRERSRDLLAQ